MGQDSRSQFYYGQGIKLGSLSQSNSNNVQQFTVIDGGNKGPRIFAPGNFQSNTQGSINSNQ